MKALLVESGLKRRARRFVGAPPQIRLNQSVATGASAVSFPRVPEEETRSPAEPARQPEHISFERFFPNATQVGIAGSFNGWEPSATPMEPFGVGCGQRKADLCLKPGIYEYRFVVDGNWVDDPCARTWVANPFGTRNAVLVVAQDDKAENCTTRNETAIISRGLSPAVGLPSKNSEWQLDRLYYQDTSCSSRVPTHRQIAELAYNLYLQRGKGPGHDVDDWLAAEKHLQTLLAVE